MSSRAEPIDFPRLRGPWSNISLVGGWDPDPAAASSDGSAQLARRCRVSGRSLRRSAACSKRRLQARCARERNVLDLRQGRPSMRACARRAPCSSNRDPGRQRSPSSRHAPFPARGRASGHPDACAPAQHRDSSGWWSCESAQLLACGSVGRTLQEFQPDGHRGYPIILGA
jgi:hypothetical protein